MEIRAKQRFFNRLKTAKTNKYLANVISTWRSDDQFVEVNLDKLTEAELKDLEHIAKKGIEAKEPGALAIDEKITAYREYLLSTDNGESCGRLEDLVSINDAMNRYLLQLTRVLVKRELITIEEAVEMVNSAESW